MALATWQISMYLDSVAIYREKLDPTTGDSLGYKQVSTGNACHFHGTPNFDTHSSAAGQSKEDNIFTANMIEVDIDVDVQSMDMAYVTLRTGLSFWQVVQGAPQIRTVLPRQKFYGVPVVPPVVVT
jgi:hypothetical protein